MLLERFLEPAVDVPRVVGLHQVYGGMHGDGTVGRCVQVALHDRGGARELRLEGTRLAGRSLYLLRLVVSIGARRALDVELDAPAAGEADFTLTAPLTEAETREPFLDVLVQAAHVTLEEGPRGPRLASFRLRRIALE